MQITPGMRPYLKAGAALSAVAVAADTYLSAKFGWSISLEMLIVYSAISFASGTILVLAAWFVMCDWRRLGIGIAAAWVPIFAFNVWSNIGVATANRMTDVQAASVQQASFTADHDRVRETAASVKMFTAQLAKLNEEQPWVGVVSADSLRKQVAEKEAAAEREAKRKGCGRLCEGLKAEVVALQAKIGTIEQRDDLAKRIQGTERLLAKYHEEAKKTKPGISQADNQSRLYAGLVSWMTGKVVSVENANEGTGVMTAIVLAILATVMTLAGAWPHLLEARAVNSAAADRMEGLTPRYPATEAPTTYYTPPAHQPAPVVINALPAAKVDTKGLARQIMANATRLPRAA